MKASAFPVFSILLLSLAIGSSAMAADRINVTSSPYNAVPNDGLDDTAQIMAAINAGSGSKSIYFPPGTYEFNGLMTLQPNTSYRLYGEGPGVSTIRFSGNAGIYAPTMGLATLNVDGLTLQANSANCGTAIYAKFSDSATKFRTALIHNVQIVGSFQDGCVGCPSVGAFGAYWTQGIYLYKAQNTVIDQLEISGNIRTSDTPFLDDDATLMGIEWVSSPEYQTTGLQISDFEIKFVRTALRTDGWVEGLYMNRFEIVLCGQHGYPAVDLKSVDTNGLNPAYRKPTFQLVNGHVDMMQNGIQLTHLRGVRLSKVNFVHNSGAVVDGAMVIVDNCFDVTVSQCLFSDGQGDSRWANECDPPCFTPLSEQTGIRVNDSHYVQITGNSFFANHLRPGCIMTQGGSDVVRITNNIFGGSPLGGVIYKYQFENPADPYLRGNYPAP